MHVSAVLLLAILLLFESAVLVEARTLVSGIAVYRHGDRTPIDFFPNDVANAMSTWDPPGPGRLTLTGMLGEYNMGAYLRTLFLNSTTDVPLLSPEYDYRQLYVRSTDYERTLQSAQAQLAGMFAPNGEPFVAGLPWTPVPVHTVPLPQDYLLTAPDTCAEAIRLNAEWQQSPAYVAKAQSAASLLAQVQNVTGFQTTLETIHDVWDTLVCDAAHNRTILPGLVPLVGEIQDLAVWWTANRLVGPRAATGGGFFVSKAVSLLKQAAASVQAGSVPSPAVNIFSAHDTTLVGILSALGYDFGGINPHFSSVLTWRLYRETDSSFTVDIDYNQQPVTLSGCARSCPIASVDSLTASVQLTDEDAQRLCFSAPPAADCGSSSRSRAVEVSLSVVVALLACLSLFLGISLAVAKKKAQSSASDADYSTLDRMS